MFSFRSPRPNRSGAAIFWLSLFPAVSSLFPGAFGCVAGSGGTSQADKADSDQGRPQLRYHCGHMMISSPRLVDVESLVLGVAGLQFLLILLLAAC
jgi:hypothetical protein